MLPKNKSTWHLPRPALTAGDCTPCRTPQKESPPVGEITGARERNPPGSANPPPSAARAPLSSPRAFYGGQWPGLAAGRLCPAAARLCAFKPSHSQRPPHGQPLGHCRCCHPPTRFCRVDCRSLHLPSTSPPAPRFSFFIPSKCGVFPRANNT